jgi:pyruvate/2-oxoglutarate dehydrogenase complex dihydrolipoamide acyltransferase (E2) component
MTTKVNLPKPGMGIDEGTVVRWLKAVRDPVKKGEPIVEIETAKALMEVEAPVSGVLIEICAAPGDVVSVNTAIAHIDENA